MSIETSGSCCSVALSEGRSLKKEIFSDDAFSHAESLAPLTNSLLQEFGLGFKDLKCVAVSAGPGSYTGLRIGASFAKGLCFALNIPLISIDTLELIARSALLTNGTDETIVIPSIDARRNELFVSAFDTSMNQLIPSQPMILDDNSTLLDDLILTKVIAAGSGSQKLTSFYSKNTIEIIELKPNLAGNMVFPVWEKFVKKEFEDVAYFEPHYTKAFFSG